MTKKIEAQYILLAQHLDKQIKNYFINKYGFSWIEVETSWYGEKDSDIMKVLVSIETPLNEFNFEELPEFKTLRQDLDFHLYDIENINNEYEIHSVIYLINKNTLIF